jgi:hypothetical protein
MQSWQKDVVAKRDEVKQDVNVLHKFIDGTTFPKLPDYEQHLLEEQYRYMYRYYDILNKRIENFEVKNGPQTLPSSDQPGN